MEYILFIFQCGNFKPRSMVVPLEAFLETRKDDYELLKRCSKTCVLKRNGKDYPIQHLLIQDVSWKDRGGTQVIEEFTYLCNELEMYADGVDDRDSDPNQVWYKGTYIELFHGFDPLENYRKCRKMRVWKRKPIHIVDSFLLLESKNGTLDLTCEFKTMDDVYKKCYPTLWHALEIQKNFD